MTQLVRLLATQLKIDGHRIAAGSVLQIVRRFETSGGARLALGDDCGKVVIESLPPERCVLLRRVK